MGRVFYTVSLYVFGIMARWGVYMLRRGDGDTTWEEESVEVLWMDVYQHAR